MLTIIKMFTYIFHENLNKSIYVDIFHATVFFDKEDLHFRAIVQKSMPVANKKHSNIVCVYKQIAIMWLLWIIH